MRVQILSKNNFQIFLSRMKNFSGFSTSPQIFSAPSSIRVIKKTKSRLLPKIIRNDQFVDISPTGTVTIDHPFCRHPLNIVIGIEIVKE